MENQVKRQIKVNITNSPPAWGTPSRRGRTKENLTHFFGHSPQAVRDDSFGVVAHLMEGSKPIGLLWLPSRNRPAQVHSTSTARWRTCHPVFSQVDGQIGRRRLKSVLPSGLFFADSTKNLHHRRSRGFYASCERHGKRNYFHHNCPKIAMSHSLP